MKRIFLLLPLIALMILSACGTPNGAENDNNLIGDVADDKAGGDRLTVVLCGPSTYDVEIAVSEFERLYETDVDLVLYNNDDDWDKFATKIMSKDSSIDLFMPVNARMASVVRNGVYQDLNDFEEVKSRLSGNYLTEMISDMQGELIGVPCNTQLTYSGDSQFAKTLMKYCYKNLNLFTGEFSDADGDEFFEVLKNRYGNPDDSKENAYYDFEYSEAFTQYVFMNKYSDNKELAAQFLCVLFDVLNGDITAAVTLPYQAVDGETVYMPSWLYYSYDYVSPIGTAFSSVADTDGSDNAIRKLASDAVYQLRMRLEG